MGNEQTTSKDSDNEIESRDTRLVSSQRTRAIQSQRQARGQAQSSGAEALNVGLRVSETTAITLDGSGGLQVVQRRRLEAVIVGSQWRSPIDSAADSDDEEDGQCTYQTTASLKQYVAQPFYRCHTCFHEPNLGCCAQCAKKCHKGHLVRYAGLAKAFCDCGLQACDMHCKIGSKCTYDVEGKKYTAQEWYECHTCWGGEASFGCCKVCAEKCHKGHDLVERFSGGFYCDCGVNGHKAAVCTLHSTGRTMCKQPFYTCRRCFVLPERGCCYQCMLHCHSGPGHDMQFLGTQSTYCDCGLMQSGCIAACHIAEP